MSLQVWLPLNGSLDNQGLDNVVVTNNGATVNNSGKIGKCYSFDGSNDKIQISNAPTPVDISIAMWFKRNATTNTRQFLYTQWQGITLELDGANKMTCSVYSNGSQCGYCKTNDTITVDSGWVHICFIFKNGVGTKLYINGSQISSASLSTPIVWGTTIGNIGYFSTYLNACINDFRIYDHALSVQEVKQIAQGLVLHFPLDRNGWGNENLALGTDVPHTTTGGKTYILSDYNLNGKTVTLSCRIDADNITLTGNQRIGVSLNYTSDSTKYWVEVWKSYRATGITSGGRVSYISGLSNNSSFHGYISHTFTCPADATTFGFGAYTQDLSSGTVTISHVKLEIGDKRTIWCPNSTDTITNSLNINSNIEYDISGFKNNGEKTTGLTYVSDTPKYEVATHIGATSQKIHVNNFITSGFGDSYSFSWWGKRSSNAPMFWGFSNGIRLNGMYLGNLWNTGDSSNNPIYKIGTTTQVTVPSTNVWHHYVMTGNGTKCYVYLDGELWGEAKTYKAISGTSLYINGWDANTSYSHDNMDISDFRIYCTALSAADVKELYEYNGLG